MSSLFKRSKWTLQYHDDDRSPSKKQFSLRTTSKRTAERLKAELDDLYQRGLFDPWVDAFRERLEELKRPDKPEAAVRLSDAREAFLESTASLADSSQRMYDLVTRLFTEHCGDARMLDLTCVLFFAQATCRRYRSTRTNVTSRSSSATARGRGGSRPMRRRVLI